MACKFVQVWFFKKIAIRGWTLQDRQANNVFFRKNAKVNSNKTIFFLQKNMFCQVCCHNREPWQQYLYSNKKIVFLATIANLATNQGLTVCLLDMPSAYALCMSIPGRQFSISFFAVNGNKYSPTNFVHSIYWVFTLRIVSGKSPQL